MSKFKIGDLVAGYDGFSKRVVGKIVTTFPEGNIHNVLWTSDTGTCSKAFHEKQLRKLKQRRVLWVHKTSWAGEALLLGEETVGYQLDEPTDKTNWLKLVEAK